MGEVSTAAQIYLEYFIIWITCYLSYKEKT